MGNMKKLILFMAVFLLLGCGDGFDEIFTDSDCNDEIQECVEIYGNPEEVYSYDSGSYHSLSYWYWAQGIEKTFTWGQGYCEVSTFTFTPIR